MAYRWSFNSVSWDPTEDELKTLSAIIQPEEKARIARFHFIKDAKSSLIGRLLIRKVINLKTKTPNSQIKLDRDNRNKPILVTPSSNINNHEDLCDLNFNVSHQGSYVVLASDETASQIGIDVMNIEKPMRIKTRVSDYFRLMDRQFTESEWKQIRGPLCALTSAQKLANFTRFWCLKESYVKAIGVGVVIDLKTLDFQTRTDLVPGRFVNDTQLRVHGVSQPDWNFEERYLDSRHIVAVAKEMKPGCDITGPEFEEVSLNFLLEDMDALGKEDDKWVETFLLKK